MTDDRLILHPTTGDDPANREQRTLDNLQAWAARGDAWARQVAAVKTRELLDREHGTRQRT